MFRTFADLPTLPTHDVCIVGTGPVGIAAAIACEDAGLRVLLLESGHLAPDRFSASLTAGHHVDARRHAAPGDIICRAFGGTSRWWGGRCVPFDDIDFATRPQALDALWPIPHDEVRAWYAAASEYLGVGPARFEMPPRITAELEDVRFDQLERWTPQNNMGDRHRSRLEQSDRIAVVFGATVVDLSLAAEGESVAFLKVAGTTGRVRIAPPAIVLACGGLETARLLLQAQKSAPSAFGGPNGTLGRGYMGHASGKIADVVLADPSSVSDHDFFMDGEVFVRRRLALTAEAQLREGLLNIAFWADNPPFHAADHRNGVLSLAWLALAIPPGWSIAGVRRPRVSHVGPRPRAWGRHALNLLRSPIAILSGILEILYARFIAKPRMPGFLIHNNAGRYALHYHAEHAPDRCSRVLLSERLDPLGSAFLDIDLQFSARDAESVVRSHEILDAALRRAGVGRLEYRWASRVDRLAAVLEQAADGFHQIGTTRMSASADDGIVDSNCLVHGLTNLWIAGSATFPSSGQANSTFVAVALAVRLANHLANNHRAAQERSPTEEDR